MKLREVDREVRAVDVVKVAWEFDRSKCGHAQAQCELGPSGWFSILAQGPELQAKGIVVAGVGGAI